MAALLGACASNLGNRADLEKVKFEIGRTQKSEVAEVLGFPAARAVENGYEIWAYRDGPGLAGIIYAAPANPSNPLGVEHRAEGHSRDHGGRFLKDISA